MLLNFMENSIFPFKYFYIENRALQSFQSPIQMKIKHEFPNNIFLKSLKIFSFSIY